MHLIDGPLVSIITPTYNHEEFIKDCIESVQAQTYLNWEMIIIDDESTDNTFLISSFYSDRDPRIQVIKQEHKGIYRLSETYNAALEITKGKYIAILEGDDIWFPEKLEEQIKIMEDDENLVITWGRAYAKSPDLNQIYGTFPHKKDIEEEIFKNEPNGIFLKILLFIDPIPAVTILIRKSVLISIGGFKKIANFPAVDHPLLLELCKYGSFYFQHKVLASWRAYANQTTKTYPVDLWQGKWKMAVEFYKNLDENVKEILPFKLKDIEIYYEKYLLIAYARSGRYKLIRQDFSGARKDYLKAIFYKKLYHPSWRIRSIIGYFASLFNANVEGIAFIFNRVSYKTK